MTTYSFGDIILVPFPFTDQSTAKKRPAVVISSNIYSRQRPDIVIMAVTSQILSASYFGDTVISEWQPAGLLRPSVIKPIITTIEKSLVIKKLGQLHKEDHKSLRESFYKILGE